MQIDLRTAELPAEPLRAEVCIVGAGIAGLTLAHELAMQGIDVLLLEAGPLTPPSAPETRPEPAIDCPSETQQGGPVEFSGYLHPGSDGPAPKAFGGTSLTWGAQLLPLPDPAPLEKAGLSRRGSLWPIARKELEPFLAEAEKILGVDGLPYESQAFFDAVKTPAPPLFAGIPGTLLRASKFAPFSHRNLAQTLGSAVLSHLLVRVLTHAHATELVMRGSEQASSRHIEAVLVRLPAGHTLRVEAKEFVVAAGTVETVRLLLASRCAHPDGIGNTHGQLGRNLHDHLTVTAATFQEASRQLVLEQLRPWAIRSAHGMTAHSLKLEAALALRERLGLGPVMAHITVEEPEDSPLGLLRGMLRERQGQGTAITYGRSARWFLPALCEAARLVWDASVHKRRHVSRHAKVALRLNCAQRTPSESRLSLSDTLDDHGQPKPVLHWNIDAEECLTLIRFASYVRQYLEPVVGPGVQWTPALFPSPDQPEDTLVRNLIHELTDARHLMGGAVMGTDPHTSVVDSDLRVRDVGNLHVASLAVFPDGSAQLPTLTLMALCLRLADRLREKLPSRV